MNFKIFINKIKIKVLKFFGIIKRARHIEKYIEKHLAQQQEISSESPNKSTPQVPEDIASLKTKISDKVIKYRTAIDEAEKEIAAINSSIEETNQELDKINSPLSQIEELEINLFIELDKILKDHFKKIKAKYNDSVPETPDLRPSLKRLLLNTDFLEKLITLSDTSINDLSEIILPNTSRVQFTRKDQPKEVQSDASKKIKTLLMNFLGKKRKIPLNNEAINSLQNDMTYKRGLISRIQSSMQKTSLYSCREEKLQELNGFKSKYKKMLSKLSTCKGKLEKWEAREETCKKLSTTQINEDWRERHRVARETFISSKV